MLVETCPNSRTSECRREVIERLKTQIEQGGGGTSERRKFAVVLGLCTAANEGCVGVLFTMPIAFTIIASVYAERFPAEDESGKP